MLQVIISPAKQMRIASDMFAPRSIPPFPTKTQHLFNELCRIEREEGNIGLQKLWRVNDKLLAENLERLERFVPVLDERQLNDFAIAPLVSAAVFSYVGIQYQSLAPEVLDGDALDWLQHHLWIISALYGCVRPFDAVEPYRLEMGAKLATDGASNLYRFWDCDIACAVCDHNNLDDRAHDGSVAKRSSSDCIVNLASVEYAKAVLPHLPEKTKSVTCIFGEELKNDKPVQRATASKIARGSMVRWMAENKIEEATALKAFDVGYRFVPELSEETGVASHFVFMRN